MPILRHAAGKIKRAALPPFLFLKDTWGRITFPVRDRACFYRDFDRSMVQLPAGRVVYLEHDIGNPVGNSRNAPIAVWKLPDAGYAGAGGIDPHIFRIGSRQSGLDIIDAAGR